MALFVATLLVALLVNLLVAFLVAEHVMESMTLQLGLLADLVTLFAFVRHDSLLGKFVLSKTKAISRVRFCVLFEIARSLPSRMIVRLLSSDFNKTLLCQGE